MVRLCPVLHRLLPLGNGEILPTRSQRVLYQHDMISLRLGVQPHSDSLTDGLGCGDMTGSLQDYRLEEDEPLRVSPSVPHPLHLLPQRPNEPSPDSPTWRVIAS